MANIRKSFNFRNGVQVDNDNFVVNANGLVGIGTSVPSQYLLNVYGDTRVTGLTTANNVYASGGLEVAGVSTVGFLTASAARVSGILTANQLVIGNSGVISTLVGYAITDAWGVPDSVGLVTTRRIGIGTDTTPSQQLGVTGDANITGIVTAASFVGNASASGLSTGTIPDARFPATLPAVSGANLTNLNGTNISSGTIAAARVATLNQNTTGTAGGLTGTPNITVGSVTGTSVSLSSGNVSLIGSSGNITAIGSVGIGTINPTENLTIKDTGSNATLEIIAPSNRSQISIGKSTALGNESSLIRYNNKKLEFINYDVGNVDTYIHDGTGTGTTGNFRWIYGQNNAKRMVLTWDGNLGINDPTPEHRLSVNGISTFTGNAHFNDNVTIDAALTVGSINLPSIINDTNINTSSGVSTISRIVSTSGAASTITNLNSDTINVNNINVSGIASISSLSELVAPSYNNAQQTGLTTAVGSIIYNSQAGKFRGYTTSGWVDFH